MVSRKERKRRARRVPDWYLRGMISGSRPREFFTHMALVITQTWITLLFLSALLIVRRFSSPSLNFVDWFLLLLIALPLLLSVVTFLGSNAETKAGMLAVRGQWEKLIEYLPRYYKTVAKALGTPRAEQATRIWNAKALIRLDRADEAIEQLEPLRTMEGLTEDDYLMARVQILMTMDDYELAREEAQMLLEADPDRVEAWGAICELEAMYFDHAEGARLALDHAITLKTWKNLGPAGDYLHGITLAAEGEHEQAIERLRQFQIWAKSFSAQVPSAWMLWAAAGCVIAHSNMRLGDAAKARAIVSDARSELEQMGLVGVLLELDSYLKRYPLEGGSRTDQLSASNV